MTTLTLRTTAMAAGGEAVARDDGGRVVFVAGALPGEAVVVEVTDEKARFARGHTVEVLEPAAERVAPPCPHLGRGCGGCGWQHVEHDAQRRLKAGIVSEALHRLGHLPDAVVELGAPSRAEGHRTTVRAGVRGGRAGLRRRHSHELVEVDTCLVAHPLLAELLAEGRFGDAAEVTLRCGARTGERLVLATPSAAGMALPPDVTLVGDDELRAGRRAWFHEEVGGRRWRVSARSFFQASPEGAEAMVAEVRKAAAGAPEGRLVDAYGGVGILGRLAGGGRPVTLLERSSSAVADARINVPEARAVRIDVDRWHPSAATLVIADPSRAGLGPKAAASLAATGATHLVLVSCDAASLGRDAGLLRSHGFRHDGSTLVELFPHTPHVEVVTRFVR